MRPALVIYSELNKYANEDIPLLVRVAQKQYNKEIFQVGYKVVVQVVHTYLYSSVTSYKNPVTTDATLELTVNVDDEPRKLDFISLFSRTQEWTEAIGKDQSPK